MRTEPLLRLRSAIGALVFATFNVIWTSVAFLLVGLAVPLQRGGDRAVRAARRGRALAAAFSGRLADRGLERWVSGGSLALIVGSMASWRSGPTSCGHWWSASWSPTSGIQAVHIQNQQLIFAIDPGGPVPAQYRVHGLLLHRRCHRVGLHRRGLRRRGVAGGGRAGAGATRAPGSSCGLASTGRRMAAGRPGRRRSAGCARHRPEQGKLTAMSDRSAGLTGSSASPWSSCLVALLVVALARRSARPTSLRPGPPGRRSATPVRRSGHRGHPARRLPRRRRHRRPRRPRRPRRLDRHQPPPVTDPVPGPVSAVGDSIMLDIQPYLEADIPGARVDGLVSRQFETGIAVVQADRAAGTLGNVLVVELGTNGTVTPSDFDAMMQAAAGVTRVVFVNVNVPRLVGGPGQRRAGRRGGPVPGCRRPGRLERALRRPPRVVHARPGPPRAGRGPGHGRP